MKFKEKPQLPTTLHQAHRIIRMITREGFCKLFEEDLKKARKIDPKISYIEVFEQMNNEFLIITGQHRYENYKSFTRRKK
ncbi:hypothetical protein K4L44_05890 [Halosquirtibacter laminarini]|uniref:Uncharacterized protein n=1 Tax=Halosquirtibacter laminarini TaxID=3374600 RepID=A0AC61NI30_9BACT|nr:hypothetical protein K4L44_05890 [Prolixibacteraceae bacterium]